jgi:hypothetical protein
MGFDAPTTRSPSGGRLGGQQRVELAADAGVGVTPAVEPGGVGVLVVDADALEGAVDGERALGPDAGYWAAPHLDVVARQESGDRPRQRGVPEHDDPLHLVGQVGAEQQTVGADRVRAGARAARRLGEKGPARALGQRPRRRSAVVAGDHHRPWPERDLGGRSLPQERPPLPLSRRLR